MLIARFENQGRDFGTLVAFNDLFFCPRWTVGVIPRINLLFTTLVDQIAFWALFSSTVHVREGVSSKNESRPFNDAGMCPRRAGGREGELGNPKLLLNPYSMKRINSEIRFFQGQEIILSVRSLHPTSVITEYVLDDRSMDSKHVCVSTIYA